MNNLEKLKFNVEALFMAVKEDQKFFASILPFVNELNTILTSKIINSNKEEILFHAKKIVLFFERYKTSDNPMYIPPPQISGSDNFVQDIFHISRKLSDDEFQKLKPKQKSATEEEKLPEHTKVKVFIGHGRSRLWARVKVFFNDELGIEAFSYESESRAGESIVTILEKMLDQATFAVLVLTAEDQTEDGSKRARQNVIHEAGLFQGRLGFNKVILLVQRGLEEFSNVAGLQYIEFSNEKIEDAFYELQRAMKKRGIIPTRNVDVGGLDKALKPDMELSDQAIGILRSLEDSGGVRFLVSRTNMGVEIIMLSSGSVIKIQEPDFLIGDINILIKTGFLIQEETNKRGDKVYAMTREAKDFIASLSKK